jgi:hypothetical protein
MNILSLESRTGWRLSALFSLILLLGVALPAGASDVNAECGMRNAESTAHRAPRSAFRILNHLPAQNCLFSASPVFADSWIGSLFTKLETWLKDRTHMIQFCAIAMVVGLLIIWWRKT